MPVAPEELPLSANRREKGAHQTNPTVQFIIKVKGFQVTGIGFYVRLICAI